MYLTSSKVLDHNHKRLSDISNEWRMPRHKILEMMINDFYEKIKTGIVEIYPYDFEMKAFLKSVSYSYHYKIFIEEIVRKYKMNGVEINNHIFVNSSIEDYFKDGRYDKLPEKRQILPKR